MFFSERVRKSLRRKSSNVQQDEVYVDVVCENDCECVCDAVAVTAMVSDMEVDDDVDEGDDEFECVHNVDYNETIWMHSMSLCMIFRSIGMLSKSTMLMDMYRSGKEVSLLHLQMAQTFVFLEFSLHH